MTGGNDEIYQLDHIAFGVADVAATTPFLVGELCGQPLASGPGFEFLWWQWQFARGATLEVLQPDGPPGGFVHRFLKSRGPGVHHVTFKVPDLAVAATRVRSLGYEVVGYNADSPSWKECFLHPKKAQGIVVQLAESHPDLEPEEFGGFPFPEAPEATADPANILGLRLSAHSEANARRQWETLLCGSSESTDRGLCFRWPDSPLEIRVQIDEKAPEGPVAIELVPPVPTRLPSGQHPVLGIPFISPESSGS